MTAFVLAAFLLTHPTVSVACQRKRRVRVIRVTRGGRRPMFGAHWEADRA